MLNISDIDECISSPCHTNAKCNNTISSYICKCKEGFNGDGTECEGNLHDNLSYCKMRYIVHLVLQVYKVNF